ncbi:DUF6153 family protein [Streptomyces sp. S.PNR 29]|uniref:DUF6153 family protein n=1 Tax=Streptomyces sp. S.PNR 29 TaxID=2973805 RepID=UPI0025AFFC7F|nr:DUF6153 family protein [Streptomyces sp. S.PNR 29]MDN0194501.1 DUF6153 family protein [Streptomyces sp. S.PNR 29]
MTPVSIPEQREQRPPSRWRWALCVLGLLVGLLGMHGLAPGGAVAEHSPTRSMTAVAMAHHGCPDDGHCGGGHVQHADSTCAAGAVSGGPVLPALGPDPAPTAVCDEAVRTYPASAPDGARAPPTLAELQLLRI